MSATVQAIIERLAKMKALSISGVGGERENAARLMETVAAKYGIDLDDIDTAEEEESLHPLDIPRGWKLDLVRQLLILMRLDKYGSKKADRCYIVCRRKFRKGRWRIVARFVRCTNSDFIELQAKFAVLSLDFDRQRKALFRAFCIANDLLLPYDPDSAPPTEEEEAHCEEAWKLSLGIRKSVLSKQLPSHNETP